MARIMVTGVSGFVGNHLVDELNRRGYEVVGVDHTARTACKGLVSYHVADMTARDEVTKLPIQGVEAIINLAGLAKVGDSFANPEKYFHINVEVLNVVGKSLLEIGSSARIVAISTGAVYDSNQTMPLTEDSRLVTDGSPYALSKIRMEQAAQSLRSQGLDCVIARPFNHIGPGQAPGFLVPDLYQKLLNARHTHNPIMVGDLTTKRDYTDVRDIVQAYADLALTPELQNDIYNVCSGASTPGSVILNTLLKELDLHQITTQIDPSFIRPGDPRDLHGSHDRLSLETNWLPKIPLAQTIRDFIANAS